MKRLLVCLLLVGVVGCGKRDQDQEAISALEKLDGEVKRDDDFQLQEAGKIYDRLVTKDVFGGFPAKDQMLDDYEHWKHSGADHANAGKPFDSYLASEEEGIHDFLDAEQWSVLLQEVRGEKASSTTAQKTNNLTTCPDCGREISKRATACPHCGAPLTQQASQPEPARPDVPRPGSQPAGQSGNAQPPAADKTTVNSIGMKLTLIPAGEFQMGSPDSDSHAEDSEKPQHLVKISKPFYLGVYEITQQQYEKVMEARPWQGKYFVKEGADYPAVHVSHDDAVEFCRRLSKQEGVEYRLPTEAEWEYACRAGTTTAYSFGDDASKLGQYAWYLKNAWDIGEKYAHRVGQKLPNRWGLYDMHGNVEEWCQDLYGPYGSEKVVSDPVGPAQGDLRVLRGGSFGYLSSFVRSAVRPNYLPVSRIFNLGFRAARTYSAAP